MILDTLRTQFGEGIESAEVVGREVRLRVSPGALVGLARACKDNGYAYLADVSAIDTESELRAVYRFCSLALPGASEASHVVIAVPVARSGARLPSLTAVYRGAEWPEREVFDMFGIRFDGHPNLSRILLTDDWEGHPLLKSFVLTSEPGHRG